MPETKGWVLFCQQIHPPQPHHSQPKISVLQNTTHHHLLGRQSDFGWLGFPPLNISPLVQPCRTQDLKQVSQLENAPGLHPEISASKGVCQAPTAYQLPSPGKLQPQTCVFRWDFTYCAGARNWSLSPQTGTGAAPCSSCVCQHQSCSSPSTCPSLPENAQPSCCSSLHSPHHPAEPPMWQGWWHSPHLGVPALLGLAGQLHSNSPTALTPRMDKSLCFPFMAWKHQTAKAPSEDSSMAAEMNRGMCWGSRGECGWTRPWSQLLALHVKAEQSMLWWWWKESIADSPWLNHSSNYQKSSKRKTKIYRMKKIQRNSHKEAEFHRTGSKPEYYKTIEVSSIKKTKPRYFTFSLLFLLKNPQSFFAQLFPSFFFLFLLNEKDLTELRG